MDIKAFYEVIGGTYTEALRRLSNDALVTRFALKFAADPSFPSLEADMAAQDAEAAFQSCHALKGVTANLAFTRLANASSELCELLRAGNLERANGLFPTVKAEYETVMSALQEVE